MEDFAAQIGQILNNPEAMSQLQSFAASLGLGGGESPAQQSPPPSPPPFSPPAQNQTNPGGIDTGQLAGMLSSLMGSMGETASSPPPAPAAPAGGGGNGIDTNMLMNMLGSLMGGGGGNTPAAPPSPPPIDMNTIMTIQKAMALFNSSNKNVELLRALRPHFGEHRQKKVDDAIKIMQLINVLPLIKESGLFGLGGDH